jgi:CheY-like chemotaxis protein
MQNKVVEILLLEDSLEDAELIVRTLKKHNLANHLLHVQDGEEALSYLMNENDFLPRLILLDLKMPKVDGIEVLKVLKAASAKKTYSGGGAYFFARRTRHRRIISVRCKCIHRKTGRFRKICKGYCRYRFVLAYS